MDRMQKAREAAALARQSKPLERLTPIQRAARNPSSLRMAITAKCFDCSGRGNDPCWRQRIRECPCPSCPLYPVRPYQQREASEDAEGQGGE